MQVANKYLKTIYNVAAEFIYIHADGFHRQFYQWMKYKVGKLLQNICVLIPSYLELVVKVMMLVQVMFTPVVLDAPVPW